MEKPASWFLPNHRAWFDILTPKQVLFFGPVVRSLEESGFEVLVTSRRYREVEPLFERSKLAVRYVGERGRKGREDQLIAATQRQAEMIPIIRDFMPQVAVSIASAVCARVAFGLGIRHISVNDSPHSEVAGRLSIPLSYHLLCPWVIPYSAWSRYGLARKQISRYRALDPAAWLKRESIPGPVPELVLGAKTITVRVEESDAPYLAGADMSWADALLSGLMGEFPDANLVALCRYDFQVEEVRAKFGSRCIVPDYVVSGRDLLAKTDLFVGMGGTMNSEAALMGVPTISAFQGSLYTDTYLESIGLLARALRTGPLLTKARRFLDSDYKTSFAKKARRVLDSMEDPVPRISAFIKNTVEQG